jgi:hypothetical protein
MRGDAAGSLHRGKAPRPVDALSAAARTTTRHRGQEEPSRCSRSLTKRCQVAPLVRLVERVLVVGDVACVHLDGAVAGQESGQRLVHQDRVGDAGSNASGIVQKRRIHRRTQSCASHATIMPRWPVGRAISGSIKRPVPSALSPPLVNRRNHGQRSKLLSGAAGGSRSGSQLPGYSPLPASASSSCWRW